MAPDFTTHHFTKDGKPDGSITYGIGFTIAWQKGALTDNGRNGAFLTDVLAACLDELKFKHSQFSCEENVPAINDLESCLKHLNDRALRRQKEGTLYQHKEKPYEPPQ